MRKSPLHRGAVVIVSCALMFTAACSGKSAGTAGDDGADVKTGPGVTTDEITVGALTDLSAVFAAQGKIIVQGNQLYIDRVNKDGGICGRKLTLLTKDHGYNVQTAVAAYSELERQVVGFTQILGAPIISALDPDIAADHALSIATSWPSTLLENEAMVILGATYDVETVNGFDYLVRSQGVKAGDKVGHIYFEGDYGNNALQGSKYAAGKLGLTLVPIQIKSTDADLTAQVTALKSQGVKAIMLSVGPRQTASVAGVSRSIGMNVPLLANTPAFDPSLLATPVKDVLASRLTVLSSYAPYASDAGGPKHVATVLPQRFPDTKPNGSVDLGYLSAYVFTEVLRKACDNGDLTREGVLRAYRQLDSLKTDGLSPTLDFSKPGSPSSRQTYVQRVDRAVPGGLRAVGEPSTAKLAADYNPPA